MCRPVAIVEAVDLIPAQDALIPVNPILKRKLPGCSGPAAFVSVYGKTGDGGGSDLLLPYQVREEAVLLHQFFIASLFHDMAPVQAENPVAVLDR